MPRLFSLTLLFLLLLLLGLFLKNGEVAATGVRRGQAICVETLLPSLFPFLVLSELLVACGAGEVLGRLFSRPVRALFGLSRGGCSALILGVLCGFPVGAATAAALCRRGEISRDELLRLLLFANNPSPGFLIGTVGGAMLGSTTLGGVLFAITWLSASAVGVFLHVVSGKLPEMPRNGVRNQLSVSDLGRGIGNAFFSLLRVFAPIIFFSCVASCAASASSRFGLPTFFATLFQGSLEMTSGINDAAALPFQAAFLMIAFFSGFAGLSVCLQLFSVSEEFRPPLLPYLGAKIAQGLLSLGLSRLFLRFSRPVSGVFSDSATTLAPISPCSVLFVFIPLAFLLGVGVFLGKRKKEG